MPDPIRKEKCDTCAFRPGTVASHTPLTLLKAMLCAIKGEPFHCHENAVFLHASGKMIDPENRNRFDFLTPGPPPGDYIEKPGTTLEVCAGFSRMVALMDAKGLRDYPRWQRIMAGHIGDIMARAEREHGWDDARIDREIRQAVDNTARDLMAL